MGYVFVDQAATPAPPEPTSRYQFQEDTPVVIPEKKRGLWDTIVGTAEQVAAGVNSGADALHKKAFGSTSENFTRNAQYWKDKATANGINQDSVYGKVAEGIGTVPAALPEWLPTPAGVAVGTALNASGGYQEAQEQGTNPIVGAFKGAAKHLAFRGAFKVIDAIPVAKMLPAALPGKAKGVIDVTAKASTMGGLMAGETALVGGDAKDVTAAFIIGAGLPLASHMMNSGKLSETLKEQGVPKEVADHLEAKGDKIDTTDPRNVDVFTDEVNKVIDIHRQVEAVTEVKKPYEMTGKEYEATKPVGDGEWDAFKVGDTTVVKNPTPADIKDMNKEFRDKYPAAPSDSTKTRFTIDANGNYYRWVSDSLHMDIEPAINKKYNTTTNQNGIEFKSHTRIIREALSEGKSVPEEIINEYPFIREQVEAQRAAEAKPTVSADPIPYKVTLEERTQAEAQAKELFNDLGEYTGATKPPESLLNLERVSTDSAADLATLYARGEMLREKVKERLGADSGKQEEAIRMLDESLLKQIGKETGIDLLAKSATTTAEMENVRIAAIKTRYMLDKYTMESKLAGDIAAKPDATPEQVAFAAWKKDLAEQYYARSVEQGRLASWILNDRKIIPDIESVLGIRDVTFEDFVANPGLVDGVMKGIEANGGMAEAKKSINDYLKAGDLQARIEKVKNRDKSTIWNTVFETSSFNMLSSIYGRAKDLFHNIVRPFADDLEYIAAAIGSGGKGVTFREAGYRIYGDVKGTMEAVSRTWEAAKEIPHPALRDAFRSPIETLYRSIEEGEAFIDARGFMHGKTKATLEGLGRKYVSRGYIETTSTGKAFSAFLEGIGKSVGAGDTVKDMTYKIVDLHGMVGRSLVFGAMKFTDLPSEYMGYNAQAYGLAARETVAKGLKGVEAAKAIEQIVFQAKALRDDIKLPSDVTKEHRVIAKKIHEESMKYALERTLKQELESNYAKEVEGFVNHTAAGKGIKILAGQYFSTPVRLLKYEMDRNVVGFLASKNMRESVQGLRGKEAQSLAIAKIALGSMAQVAAATLISNGVITLLAPIAERKSWRDAGILEVGLNLNGRLYKLSALEPFGNFISSMVAVYSGLSESKNEDSNAMWEITKAMIHDRTQRSYLKSLFDLNGIMNGEQGAMERFMLGQGSKLIPYSGLLSSATDMYGNGEVRATDGMGDLIAKVYNPSTLDVAPDQYGKPRATTERFFGVPTSIAAKEGSVRSEVVRLGISLPNPPKVLPLELGDMTKYGYKMSPVEQRDYLRSLANDPINMEENMQKVVDSPGYKAAPEREQKRILQEVITMSHGAAKDLLYKKPEVLEAAKKQGIAVKEWYGTKTPIPTHENWLNFLTEGKTKERKVMHQYDLKATETRGR